MQDNYERSHDTSIEWLIEEFGQQREEEIRTVYNHQRQILEQDVSIYDFLPIFTYKIAKQILRAEDDPSYLERKVEKARRKRDMDC